jgi:hypothetical protein
VYSAVREKAVKQEAYMQLTATREAEARYASVTNTFTTSFTNIDFDPNTTNTGITKHYTYAIPTANTTTLVVTATRISTVAPTVAAVYTMTIDQAGTISG